MTDTLQGHVGTEVQAEKHQLNITDATGHTSYAWAPDVKAEVKTAKAAFDAAKKHGMLAYDVEKGEVIRKFDPKVTQIVMTPQLVGG